MSTEGRIPDEGMTEADLLQWIVDPDKRRSLSRAEVEEAAGTSTQLAELEGFVSRCRAACHELDAQAVLEPDEKAGAKPDALVERVLERTTREDLSIRGDLRLVGGFCMERVRSSMLLRVAAASLLLHFFALPIIAWYVWRTPEPEQVVVVGFDYPPPLPFDPELVPETPPELDSALPGELELVLPADTGRFYVENSLRWGRYTLLRDLPELPEAAGVEAPSLRALRARLAGEGGSVELDDMLAQALECERLLDLSLTLGSPPAGLEAALTRLAAAELDGGPEGLLATSALARADSYGLLPRDASDALRQAQLDLRGTTEAEALTAREGEERRIAPYDPRWLELCARCGERAGWPRPVIEALRR